MYILLHFPPIEACQRCGHILLSLTAAEQGGMRVHTGCVSGNNTSNIICSSTSDTEIEPGSAAISVWPRGKFNLLLQKVTATILKASPTLTNALSFQRGPASVSGELRCLPLHPSTPYSQLLMAASNGATVNTPSWGVHQKSSEGCDGGSKYPDHSGKKKKKRGQRFSLGGCIHQPFPHLRHLKKKKTVALTVKDCQKSPKAANSMLAGFELCHG